MSKIRPAWPLLLALLISPLCASDCSRTSTGLIPLNELGAGVYQGMMGGLYPGGSNRRPAAHDAAGLRLTGEVLPRNAVGEVDKTNGKIVLLSAGMSNTTQEFQVFKATADRDAQKNPQLTIVDGAQGGWSANRLVAGGAEYWSTVDQRLRQAGVTVAQVQVVWMKQADSGPTLSFPADARQLQSELKTLAVTLRLRYPNLRLLYLSSRIYGGYASTTLNPEPFAYQSGFAVKGLIERQIQGDPELSYEAGRAPWMAWGPYLWADGTRARSDGLSWNCSDFQEADGTHPALPARQKVAAMLLEFLKTDATARSWFLKAPAQAVPAPVAAAVVNAASFRPPVAPGSITTLFGSGMAVERASADSFPLPVILRGTSVEVDGIPCPLYYVSPGQINFLMPREVSGGRLVVRREGLASNPLEFAWSPRAPGFFTLAGAVVAALHADYRLISEQDPARRGETILLFGTGLGAGDPRPLVRIGGFEAKVLYAGPAPGFPGLDQINVTVPPEAPLGPAVRVDLQVDRAAANVVSLSVM